MAEKYYLICAVCGKGFESDSHNAKYCSRECREKAQHPNVVQRGVSRWGHVYEHTCLWCGKKFSSGSPRGDYCSPGCRKKSAVALEENAKQNSLTAIANRASELGMSYGQYVAYMERAERENNAKKNGAGH